MANFSPSDQGAAMIHRAVAILHGWRGINGNRRGFDAINHRTSGATRSDLIGTIEVANRLLIKLCDETGRTREEVLLDLSLETIADD